MKAHTWYLKCEKCGYEGYNGKKECPECGNGEDRKIETKDPDDSIYLELGDPEWKHMTMFP